MTDTLQAVLPCLRLDDAGRALLFTEARTANSFAPTPVTDQELAEIWELAKWPPTAANVQPLRVLYIRTDEGKSRLLPLMSDGNRGKTATAPVVAVLAVDTAFHDHIPAIFPHNPGMKDYFEADAGAREGTGRFSAGLQIGYFLLAVRAVGLAAGPMAGFDRDGSTRSSSRTADTSRCWSSTSAIRAITHGSIGCPDSRTTPPYSGRESHVASHARQVSAIAGWVAHLRQVAGGGGHPCSIRTRSPSSTAW